MKVKAACRYYTNIVNSCLSWSGVVIICQEIHSPEGVLFCICFMCRSFVIILEQEASLKGQAYLPFLRVALASTATSSTGV